MLDLNWYDLFDPRLYFDEKIIGDNPGEMICKKFFNSFCENDLFSVCRKVNKSDDRFFVHDWIYLCSNNNFL